MGCGHEHRYLRRRLALLVALALAPAACGGGSRSHRSADGVHASAPLVGTGHGVVVARIGTAAISLATYEHWMAIGAATVEMPKPTGPLPKVVEYVPPEFTACVAQLRANAPSSTLTAPLRAQCRRTYKGIQARILNFLITGYWLRGEAAEQHASVSEAEVRNEFDEERRAHYPTAASFRRVQEASRQTVSDLMFAVETRMLSAKLLEKFRSTHSKGKSEQATIAAFNKSVRSTWALKTNCQPGYVVPDCEQYKP